MGVVQRKLPRKWADAKIEGSKDKLATAVPDGSVMKTVRTTTPCGKKALDENVAVGELKWMHHRDGGNDHGGGCDPNDDPPLSPDAHRPNEKKISDGFRHRG